MIRRSLVPISVVSFWLALVVPGRALTVAPFQTAGATISGSLVDGSLNPVVAAQVSLESGARVVARTTSNAEGRYSFMNVAVGEYQVRAVAQGSSVTRAIRVTTSTTRLVVPLVLPTSPLESKVTPPPPGTAPPPPPASLAQMPPSVAVRSSVQVVSGAGRGGGAHMADMYQWEGDRYAHVEPGRFQDVSENPLSTFGADVDSASYTNVRRFLSEGRLPPTEAVRVEEMLNYFHPEFAEPRGRAPLAITTEVGPAPWNPEHRLVLIGVKARRPAPMQYEGRNIVLLVDVSGSMSSEDRLPLIKTALGLFVDSLHSDDRLAIVTYAGTSGVHLHSTPVRERSRIQRAIESLNAGGSTNGAQGIVTAYRVAREAFIPGGINRVMLATDGDFNVGMTSQAALVRLIERERDSGVFLSIFGVGRGNLNDASLEAIANRGNGHYTYLDSLQEARRVMLREMDAMLETVAKDVKFQVAFNPDVVNSWKLIGYENRVMADRDFDDDRKDGGELGAGHTVTMLYEIEPARARSPRNAEWLTVSARFKAPDGDESDLISVAARDGARPRHLPFAAVVAEFGLLLRSGERAPSRWAALEQRVAEADTPVSLVADKAGLLELVQTARGLVRLRR